MTEVHPVAPEMENPNAAQAPDGAARVDVMSSLLQSRPELLVPLAADFAARRLIVESSIRGSSMWPGIPRGSRLRIRVGPDGHYAPGAIVYYLADDGYMVHRVVHTGRQDFLLTRGDSCIAPDPPVRPDRILGTVTEISTGDRWRSPGPAGSGSPLGRAARALTLAAVIGLLHVSPGAARRAALVLRRVDAAWRDLR